MYDAATSFYPFICCSNSEKSWFRHMTTPFAHLIDHMGTHIPSQAHPAGRQRKAFGWLLWQHNRFFANLWFTHIFKLAGKNFPEPPVIGYFTLWVGGNVPHRNPDWTLFGFSLFSWVSVLLGPYSHSRKVAPWLNHIQKVPPNTITLNHVHLERTKYSVYMYEIQGYLLLCSFPTMQVLVLSSVQRF